MTQETQEETINDLIRSQHTGAAAAQVHAPLQHVAPGIGETVWYGMLVQAPEGTRLVPRPAIVVEDRARGAALRVLSPTGPDRNEIAHYSPELTSGCWTWPTWRRHVT